MGGLITSLVMENCVNRLSYVYRFTGTPLCRQVNIAEHTYYVAVLADIIATDIQHRYPKITIDSGKVVKYALYHDFEETFTGDIITPVKYKSKGFKKELEKIAKQFVKEGLKEDFEGREHVAEMIKSYFYEYNENKYETLEAQIVKFADQVEALMYSISEYKLGNTHFADIIEATQSAITTMWSDNKYLAHYMEEIEALNANKILHN